MELWFQKCLDWFFIIIGFEFELIIWQITFLTVKNSIRALKTSQVKQWLNVEESDIQGSNTFQRSNMDNNLGSSHSLNKTQTDLKYAKKIALLKV